MRARSLLLLASLGVLGCSGGSAQSSPKGGTGTTAASSGTTGSGCAGGGGGHGGAGPTGEIAPSVQRYEYAFDLTTSQGRSQVDLDVAAPGGNCTALDYALATVTGVGWNGAPATSDSIASQKLDVCGPGVGAGTLPVTAQMTVVPGTYWDLDVGYSQKKDLAGGTFTYLLSWIGGCDRFGPCDADPSTLAQFHIEVTHDPSDVVLCPGTLTPGSTVTTCDLSGTLAPTYSAFGLASDPLWVRTPFLTAANVDVVLYEVPGGQIGATIETSSASAYVEWITGLLGPYPYGGELRYAGGPTVWLGFEHPGNIVLNESLPTLETAYANPTMHTFMHEMVHMWAGNRTTLLSAEDFVWKEASAEYLSYVFEDEQRPPAEAASSLSYWESVSLQSAFYPRPTDNPPPPVQEFFGDVYGPGPMTLYVQLETMLGRPVVLAGIQSFLAQPGAKSADDLRLALEAASGKSLSTYFDTWVFGSGKPEWPTLSVATTQAGDQVTVTVTQDNASGKIFGCEVEVEVQGATANTTALVDFGLAPTSTTAQTMVTLAQPVTGTVLEPRHRLIHWDGQPAPHARPREKRRVWIL
jgi:aminopeptidase N